MFIFLLIYAMICHCDVSVVSSGWMVNLLVNFPSYICIYLVAENSMSTHSAVVSTFPWFECSSCVDKPYRKVFFNPLISD
jgi:membrane-bound acyltransferase YfiQ involved in biofilm formation